MEISQLEQPGITIEVHREENHRSHLFTTIGTMDYCEHPDADSASRFLAALLASRRQERAKLEQPFDKL